MPTSMTPLLQSTPHATHRLLVRQTFLDCSSGWVCCGLLVDCWFNDFEEKKSVKAAELTVKI
jgi:hypothetical protein